MYESFATAFDMPTAVSIHIVKLLARQHAPEGLDAPGKPITEDCSRFKKLWAAESQQAEATPNVYELMRWQSKVFSTSDSNVDAAYR